MSSQALSFGGFGGTLGLQCFVGQVTLFRFIQPPQPGSIIGQLSLLTGGTLPLIQTQPTPLGGISLSSVDGQIARLCGVLTSRSGQTVLDVRLVNPGAPSPTGTPLPFDNQLLLRLLLQLLLAGGGQGIGLGLGTGLGTGFGSPFR